MDSKGHGDHASSTNDRPQVAGHYRIPSFIWWWPAGTLLKQILKWLLGRPKVWSLSISSSRQYRHIDGDCKGELAGEIKSTSFSLSFSVALMVITEWLTSLGHVGMCGSPLLCHLLWIFSFLSTKALMTDWSCISDTSVHINMWIKSGPGMEWKCLSSDSFPKPKDTKWRSAQ